MPGILGYTLLMSSVAGITSIIFMMVAHACGPLLGGGPIVAANFGLPEPVFGLNQISMTNPLWQYTWWLI